VAVTPPIKFSKKVRRSITLPLKLNYFDFYPVDIEHQFAFDDKLLGLSSNGFNVLHNGLSVLLVNEVGYV
jgi:hypothetical protein